jgi:SAM-dependent methyltransferase
MKQAPVGRHYQGEAGVLYAQKHGSGGELGYRLNAEFFLPYLKTTDVILEFGCGNAGMLRVLKSHVTRAEGLEVNPTARQAALLVSGCTIHAGLHEIPEEPVYDAIVSNHVLEHIRDVCSTLEMLRIRLKPGGRLIVMLPIDDFREPHQRKWDRDDNDHHLHTWSPRLFANTLYDSGYDVQDVQVITSAWHPALYRFMRFGLTKLVCWSIAVLLKRRQIRAVAVRPT